jgi:uncharacterized protein (TIGR00156 family)
MKKIILLMLSLSILAGTGLFAASQAADDESDVAATVEDAKEHPKGTKAVLTGNIIKQNRNDTYLFKDSTGEIALNISKKKFKGVTFTPGMKVTVYGEVNNYMRSGLGKSITIDVSKVQADSSPPSK